MGGEEEGEVGGEGGAWVLADFELFFMLEVGNVEMLGGGGRGEV